MQATDEQVPRKDKASVEEMARSEVLKDIILVQEVLNDQNTIWTEEVLKHKIISSPDQHKTLTPTAGKTLHSSDKSDRFPGQVTPCIN